MRFTRSYDTVGMTALAAWPVKLEELKLGVTSATSAYLMQVLSSVGNRATDEAIESAAAARHHSDTLAISFANPNLLSLWARRGHRRELETLIRR